MHGLTFGVEVEYTGLDKYQLHRLLLSRFPDLFVPFEEPSPGTLAPFEHNSRLRLAFVTHPTKIFGIKSDGSVTKPGGEIVTPILREEDIPLFGRFMAMVRTVSCIHCDMSCGLHVHVGLAGGEIPQHLQDVVTFYNWRTIQPRIKHSFRPNDHRNMNYCSIYFNARDFGVERKLAVNTTQLHHPTTEFRLFDGHLNFRYIMRAVKFSCVFVALASKGIQLQNPPRGLSLEKFLEASLVEGTVLSRAQMEVLLDNLGEEKGKVLLRAREKEEAYWRGIRRREGPTVDIFDGEYNDYSHDTTQNTGGTSASYRVSYSNRTMVTGGNPLGIL